MKCTKAQIFLFIVAIFFIGGGVGFASETKELVGQLPIPLESYTHHEDVNLWGTLVERVQQAPFNLVASVIFLLAVVHTFMAGKFLKLSKKFQKAHDDKMAAETSMRRQKDAVCFKAELCHFLGEVEAIFGIWVVPLVFAMMYFYDWSTVVVYINEKVNYIEPLFVVVIMIIASTRPIIKLAETCLRFVAKIGNRTPGAWWLSILIIAPLLGSFITEPAAMTIGAMLLSSQFYELNPSSKLKYATLGLLFVNVSVGGTLTNFAAPPILMVANTWGWDNLFMFINFGDKALLGITVSTLLYFIVFRKEFQELKVRGLEKVKALGPDHETETHFKDYPIPWFVTFMHIGFLVWTVVNLHYVPFVIGGFLFFLAFTQLTLHHQYMLKIRNPLLVGFFLAGLVTHGGLQQWWLEPVLSVLTEVPLFIGATVLTAFNDNAAITYLASLVPEFAHSPLLQKAVVYGAVTGGGLTVIANAPNPAGQSLLSRHFKDGISPMKLFLGAIIPTIIMSCAFMLTP